MGTREDEAEEKQFRTLTGQDASAVYVDKHTKSTKTEDAQTQRSCVGRPKSGTATLGDALRSTETWRKFWPLEPAIYTITILVVIPPPAGARESLLQLGCGSGHWL